MANWYVNPSTGDDENSGAFGYPKKHINAMIQALVYPLAGENIIHLEFGTYEEESGGVVMLHNITCAGPSGRLIVQPAGWIDDNYQSGLDPFDETDPAPINAQTQTFPLTLSLMFHCQNTIGVELRGLEIAGDGLGVAVAAYGPSSVRVVYCRTSQCASAGFIAVHGGSLTVENSCANDCGAGFYAFDRGSLRVQGDTYLYDNAMAGLAALLDSTILVSPWEDRNDYAVVEIRTTKPAAETTGIAAMLRSTISICVGDDMMPIPGAVLVKIIDQTILANSEKHVGARLGSKALLSGKRNIVFREAGLNDNEDTIAPAVQFVQEPGEDTLLTE